MFQTIPDRPLSKAERVKALWPEGVEVMRALAGQPREPEAAAFARAALAALGGDPDGHALGEKVETPRQRAPITDGVG